MLASTSYTNVTPAATRGSDARIRVPVAVSIRNRLVVSQSVSSRRLSLRTHKAELAQQLKAGKSRHRARWRSRHGGMPIQMCGIIGLFTHEGSANAEIFEGLLMLQHRGQDSAGMVTYDGHRFCEHKDNGLVNDVFGAKTMKQLRGHTGIGHVRYPTAGSASAQEAQPFFVNSPLGIYLIHNGNVTNTNSLRQSLEGSQSFFNRHLRTDSDSEVLLNVFADEIHRAHQRCSLEAECNPHRDIQKLVLEAGESLMRLLQGAYSCICLVKGVGLVAFRDPHGIRPLVLGSRVRNGKKEYCVASEDCAFGPVGFQRVRDVAPGEMLIVTEQGELVSKQCMPGQTNPCIFEYIYLARPDSVLNDISVYNFQMGLGTRLAERIKSLDLVKDIDCVVPVPDGSRPAAIQMSAHLGLPYREGLVKNRYVGRTFIMPDQHTREMSVRRKLNAMPAVFEGKKVLLVDDSIVRGTTMSQIVEMVRKAGAVKVYLASASPPVRYPNVYGVDMPVRSEFVASDKTEEEICRELGADALIYQSLDDLVAVGHDLNPSITEFDTSCFTGEYVSKDVTPEYLLSLETASRTKDRTRAGRLPSIGHSNGVSVPQLAPLT